MTDREMLQKLLEHGSKMRDAQKKYYAHPGGSAAQKQLKKYLLVNSKQAEAQFDNAMFNIKQLLK